MDPDCYDCLNINVQVCGIELGCGPLYDCYAECVVTRCPGMEDSCIMAECSYDRDLYQMCLTETVQDAECNEYTMRCLD
jgi:hypothetical protein